MADLMARMAEIAASQHAGDVLVGLGLGSCIGLALTDGSGRAAALAHIVLPASDEISGAATPAKFADTAVPALVTEIGQMGVQTRRLWAVMVGGAQMFALGGGMDIGSRNDQAVREALARFRIPVRASVTGGAIGRTIRVYVGSGRITYKEAGGQEIELLPTEAELRSAA